MSFKKCFKCGEVKALSAFYKHKQMADGRVNKCKDCTKEDVRKNYRKNIDHFKEYDRKRAMLPERVKARADYQKTEAGKDSVKKSKIKWRDKNPVKYRAARIVGNAVRDGKLEKPESCSNCGKGGRIHGHHCDYAKPLDVMWLCPKCHNDWHRENGEGLNSESPVAGGLPDHPEHDVKRLTNENSH